MLTIEQRGNVAAAMEFLVRAMLFADADPALSIKLARDQLSVALGISIEEER